MAVAEGFRRFARIGLHETTIRVRQIHHQKMDLAFNTADYDKRFTEICLDMAGRMRQRHEHLALTLPGRKDVILHDRDAAGKAVLITQPFKNPLRGMPLLLRDPGVGLKDLVNDPSERIKLRAANRFVAPVARRH